MPRNVHEFGFSTKRRNANDIHFVKSPTDFTIIKRKNFDVSAYIDAEFSKLQILFGNPLSNIISLNKCTVLTVLDRWLKLRNYDNDLANWSFITRRPAWVSCCTGNTFKIVMRMICDFWFPNLIISKYCHCQCLAHDCFESAWSPLANISSFWSRVVDILTCWKFVILQSNRILQYSWNIQTEVRNSSLSAPLHCL